MTNKANLGAIIGILGGISAIILMAFRFEVSGVSIGFISAYMLIAALFFAIGGSFTNNGQWTHKVAILMGYVTLGVILACLIFGILPYVDFGLFMVFGIALLAYTYLPAVGAKLNYKV